MANNKYYVPPSSNSVGGGSISGSSSISTWDHTYPAYIGGPGYTTTPLTPLEPPNCLCHVVDPDGIAVHRTGGYYSTCLNCHREILLGDMSCGAALTRLKVLMGELVEALKEPENQAVTELMRLRADIMDAETELAEARSLLEIATKMVDPTT